MVQKKAWPCGQWTRPGFAHHVLPVSSRGLKGREPFRHLLRKGQWRPLSNKMNGHLRRGVPALRLGLVGAIKHTAATVTRDSRSPKRPAMALYQSTRKVTLIEGLLRCVRRASVVGRRRYYHELHGCLLLIISGFPRSHLS